MGGTMKVSTGGGEEQGWEEYGGYGGGYEGFYGYIDAMGAGKGWGKGGLKGEEKEKGTEHASIVGKWGTGQHNAQIREREKENLEEDLGREDMGARWEREDMGRPMGGKGYQGRYFMGYATHVGKLGIRPRIAPVQARDLWEHAMHAGK